MKTTRLLIISVFLLLLFFPKISIATVYFYWDAETHPCDGSPIPNPPFGTEEGEKGHVICSTAPQGNRFFEWPIAYHQHSFYTEVRNSNFPITGVLGKTFYLAYYFNVTRINGIDVWHLSGDSADKGVELNGGGFRIIGSRGHWLDPDNQVHRYTAWLGEGNHLNNHDPSWEPALELYDVFYLNQGGYSSSNHIQLEYEKWYAYVLKVKLNSRLYAQGNTPDGEVAVWINGVKILEYTGMWVASGSSPTIDRITIGGTLAQPAYDCPAHKQQFDALMLTDNWQDIISGGYMTNSPSPAPPSGLRIVPPSN